MRKPWRFCSSTKPKDSPDGSGDDQIVCPLKVFPMCVCVFITNLDDGFGTFALVTHQVGWRDGSDGWAE
jgi:hypothetical protein